jgi:hypothetical protein
MNAVVERELLPLFVSREHPTSMHEVIEAVESPAALACISDYGTR